MTKEEIIEYATAQPAAAYDCPFDGLDATVLRHSDTGRWFGIVMEVPEKFFGRREMTVCLKCPPDLQPLLIEQYAGIIFKAYHMNKTHWITVRLSLERQTLEQLIRLSYDITDKRRKQNDKSK